MTVLIPYYNFLDTQILRDNHIKAVRIMTDAGARCVTLQLSLRGQPTRPIEPWDNHLVMLATTGSMLWHKEALINWGFFKLRAANAILNDKLMWIDSGCYLEDATAYEATATALDSYDVVQAFQQAHFLGQQGEIVRTARGVVQSIANPPLVRCAF